MSTNNKKFSKRAGLLLALPLTFGLAGLAVARPGGPGGEGKRAHDGPMSAKMQKCRTEFKAKKLAVFDLDKDGTLSPEERTAAHTARKAERLAEYDKDKDGTLSEAERKEAQRDRMVEMFEGADSNSDAEISAAEAEASCSPMARHFDKVDADGNGKVTWTEFEAKAKMHGKRGHGKRGHGMREGRGHGKGEKGMREGRGQRGAKTDAE